MEFMDMIEITRVDNVKYCRQIYNEKINGIFNEFFDVSLCLTSHHIIFTSKNKEQEFWLLHCLIDALEPRIRETRFQIILKCKDFQTFIVDFPSLYHCQAVLKSLEALSNITSDNMKYPFFSQIKFKIDENGWEIYSIENEFKQFFGDSTDCEWRISDVNLDYSVCKSYAKKVIVPKNIEDATFVKSSQFRFGGRFPVLSYYHKSSKSFMMRCSQPLLGQNNKRCKEDENILKNALPVGKKGHIFDLRDVNVMKNATYKGGGYETDAHYPLWKRINRHLDRFDQLHVSFSKLVEGFSYDNSGTPNSNSVDKWLNKVESSGWFGFIRQALHISCCIADELHNKNGCVIVHGSDGTDNTLLVTSLVQILLNPRCRTIKGFEMLIEREWIQAGHPFSRRCFKSGFGSTVQKNEGPVFLIFLDCVRQLLDQFSISFEFNEDFLILLVDNAYASEFGTFLGNNQLEREQLHLSSRTKSLWSYVNSSDNYSKYLNPLYVSNSAVLWPSLYFQSFSFWSNLFLRYQRNENPFKETKNEILKLVEADNQARLKVAKLRSELLELQKDALARGILALTNDN